MPMVTGKSWMQHSRLAAVACGDRAAFAFREHFLVKKFFFFRLEIVLRPEDGPT